MCHQAVHCKLRFPSYWEKTYGKDKGFVMLARKFLEIYDKTLLPLRSKDLNITKTSRECASRGLRPKT